MDKIYLKCKAEEFLQKMWGTSKMLILGGDAREVLADFAESVIGELEQKIVDLKKDFTENQSDCAICGLRKDNENLKEELSMAKQYIINLIDCLKNDDGDQETNYYIGQYINKAEKFLNEGK